MWGTFLSEPLPIVALVGRYPANQLMGRTPILYRYKYLSSISHAKHGMHAVLILLSQGYPAVKGRSDTRYSPVRRSPSYLASQVHAAPRLACVKPVASVHPEPGSNSPLYILSSYFSLTDASIDSKLPYRSFQKLSCVYLRTCRLAAVKSLLFVLLY